MSGQYIGRIKRTYKSGMLNAPSNQSVKDSNGNLVFSIDDQLNVWYTHYKNLASGNTHCNLYKPYWNNPYLKKTPVS